MLSKHRKTKGGRKGEKGNGDGVLVLESMIIYRFYSSKPSLSPICPKLPKLTHKEAIFFLEAVDMLGTRGESSADCQMPKCESK